MYSGEDTAEYFAGVYAVDELTRINNGAPLPAPFSLIVNTQTRNLPSEHWISIWVDRDPRKAEIFDPLVVERWSVRGARGNRNGAPNRRIRRWLYHRQGVRGRVTSNTYVMQDLGAPVCGHFAVLYCLKRPLCSSLSRFMKTYLSRDVKRNTQSVVDFVENI